MVINAECGKTVRIAYQGENKRQQVRFDLADIMGEFPGGTAVLAILRSGDTDPVPAAEVELDTDGKALVWTVTAWECAVEGFVYAQVTYVVDDVVAKTRIWRFDVKNSLVVSGAEPEEWADLVGQLVTAAAGVNTAIEAASEQLRQYVADAEAAESAAAQSATAAGTAQAAAETAQRAAEEAVGQYDDMTATATGLAAGSAPTAEIDHTGSAPVLRLGIPAGERGADGAQGPQGERGPAGPAGPKGDPGEAADVIDDTAASTSKTYSSSKLETQREELLSAIERKFGVSNLKADGGLQVETDIETGKNYLVTEVYGDTIAPSYFDLTFPVKQGQYCYFGRNLWIANTEIASQEYFNRNHWTQVDVGTSLDAKEDKPGLVVTFLSITPDAGNVATGTVTADKTPDEVLAAYTAGKTIKAISTISGTPMECDLQIAYETFASFECPVGRSMYYQVSGNPGGNWTYQLRNSLIGDTQSYWVWYHRLTNVTDPVDAQDAATKKYVDNAKADVDKNKADIIITNASGSIAAITDGADDLPIEDMVVQIEPVQDLHGQSNPYPGGGGKNLITITEYYGGYNKTANTNLKTPSTAVVTENANVITITSPGNWQGRLIATSMLPAGTYTVHVEFSDADARATTYTTDSELIVITNEGNSTSTIAEKIITITEPRRIAITLVNSAAKTNTYTNLQVESGQSYTSWSPYSNICPISGWTGCNVSRCGKNLVPMTAASRTSSGITYTVNADGSVTINGTATATSWMRGASSIEERQFLRAGTYHLSGTPSGKPFTVYLVGAYVDGTNLSQSNVGGGVYDTGRGLTFTLNMDATVTYQIQVNNGTTVNNVTVYPQIESGSTTTAYEPYQGSTYPITFDSAGTIYGGTLNPVTGELVVDRASIILNGTLTDMLPGWQARSGSSAWLYRATLTPDIEETSSGYTIPNIISDMLPTVAYTPIYGGTIGISRVQGTGAVWGLAVRVPVEGLTTAQLINAWLAEHPIHVVYKITNPQTYTLTPTEIRTLLGYNAIFADVGDVSVDYRADTKLYIDNKITQAIAAALNS